MTRPARTSALLSVRGLSKSFPGQRALDDVDLRVGRGEIVAVVGQNGSGKSTLVKILTGVYEADAGALIEVETSDGTTLTGAAVRNAIHVIHQDLGLIGPMTGLENLNLFNQRPGLAPVRPKQELHHAHELLAALHAKVNLTARIEAIPPGERALLAIVRALDGWRSDDEILVLDEPTTALHESEVQHLFQTVRKVASRGAGVIFISHRLDEVLGLAHRVVALRAGRVVADAPAGSLDRQGLIRLIVGRDLPAEHATTTRLEGRTSLQVRDLVTENVRGVDLDIRSGEVVGLCGILGSGREQVAGALFGARVRAGTVQVLDRVLPPANPGESIKRGLAYVPADRRTSGAVMSLTARENLTLAGLRVLRGRFGVLKSRAERSETKQWTEAVRLDPLDPERPLDHFSGGNQQKVVLAKWLRNKPAVLLLDEPTQGVDVGARATVYELIRKAAGDGAAVLVSSSDTAELAALCDRVIVMSRGQAVDEINRGATGMSEADLVTASLAERAPNANGKVCHERR